MRHALRRTAVAAVLTVLLVGLLAALASAAGKPQPPAPPNNPVITFVTPTPSAGAELEDGDVTFAFTFNRTPKQVASVTCALTGQASVSDPCDAPFAFPAGSKTTSKSGESYTGLANGSYTFTVTLTLTGGGVYTATRAFTVDEPLPPPPGHFYWMNGSSASIARSDMAGQNVNSNFIAAGTPGTLDGLAVDESHVYWVNQGTLAPNSGSIGRADLNGQNADPSFITGLAAPQTIAVDDGHIYFTLIGGHIGRADLDGQNVDTTFITGLAYFTKHIAVNSSHVYWTTGLSVGRADIDGQNVDPTFIASVNSTGLALDNDYLYWGINISTGSSIARADLDGQNADTSFMSVSGGPQYMAISASHLFWTDSSTNSVYRSDLDGQNVGVFIPPIAAALRGIAVGTG